MIIRWPFSYFVYHLRQNHRDVTLTSRRYVEFKWSSKTSCRMSFFRVVVRAHFQTKRQGMGATQWCRLGSPKNVFKLMVATIYQCNGMLFFRSSCNGQINKKINFFVLWEHLPNLSNTSQFSVQYLSPPTTKWGKVMFLVMSVCPQRRSSSHATTTWICSSLFNWRPPSILWPPSRLVQTATLPPLNLLESWRLAFDWKAFFL